MPTAILLAGPNGAGKTTFATRYLRRAEEAFVFLNPDEIARTLVGLSGTERDMRAGRLLLAELERVVESGTDFVVETTLSSRLYAQRIPSWRERGYRVGLMYLKLPDALASVGRVAERSANGGHNVAEADLLRRYDRSVSNLETVYKLIVDEWQVWAARDGAFELLERSAQ